MKRVRHLLVGLLVCVVMVVARPDPGGAAFSRWFGLWDGDPVLCAVHGGGGVQHLGGYGPLNKFTMGSGAFSKNLSSGWCDTTHYIYPGFVGAMSRLQVWYGAWVICVPGPHDTNDTIYGHARSALDYFDGCGANSTYRYWGAARITRPNGDHHDNAYEGVVY